MIAFTYRPARDADFDLLRRLHRAGMHAHVTALWGWDEAAQERLLRERFEPERLSVIVSEGRDVGMLQVSRAPGAIRLDNLLIDPAWQGCGIGSAILRELTAEAAATGAALTLSVLKPNPAKALYERMGFAVTGEDDFRYAMAYRPFVQTAGPLTPIDAVEAAFVARLAGRVRPGAGDAVLLGEGSNNWVYRLGEGGGAVVLKLGKPHRARFAAREHVKEHWCAAAARAAGAQTPESLAVGDFEGRSYQVQAFSQGRSPRPEEQDRAWEAIGGWARAFHAAPVAGWGPQMSGDGVFAGDWAAHLAYNIRALAPDDPLLELGVLDAAASADLKRRFERLAAKP
ncbi:MAG TPA: GNAT family N-acetyltransferase, partial [Caulobacteraceae bacterium]